MKTINNLTDTSPSFLILGYGNDLRCDDAVGQKIADAVATWSRPNVNCLSVRQLTPELAEMLANTDFAIFVDAYPAIAEQVVQVRTIEVSDKNITMGHSTNPSYLLALTQAIYDRVPQAWWVMVPGVNFQLGNDLSPVAFDGMKTALEKIDRLIKTARK